MPKTTPIKEVPELEMYKQGEQHFKSHNLQEAVYQVASATAILQDIHAKLGNQVIPEQLQKVIEQSKQPLELVIGNEIKLVCTADVILPLAQLINRCDTRIRKALSKLTTNMEIK